MGSRNGGISNWPMTKLGTPIGAGPELPTVSVGFALVGTPLGWRGGGGAGALPCCP